MKHYDAVVIGAGNAGLSNYLLDRVTAGQHLLGSGPMKLVSGAVSNPREAHLRKSDQRFGWVCSCVAFPTGDIEIQL